MRVKLTILALALTGFAACPAGATPPPAATSGASEAASTDNSPTTGGATGTGENALSGAPTQGSAVPATSGSQQVAPLNPAIR